MVSRAISFGALSVLYLVRVVGCLSLMEIFLYRIQLCIWFQRVELSNTLGFRCSFRRNLGAAELHYFATSPFWRLSIYECFSLFLLFAFLCLFSLLSFLLFFLFLSNELLYCNFRQSFLFSLLHFSLSGFSVLLFFCLGLFDHSLLLTLSNCF